MAVSWLKKFLKEPKADPDIWLKELEVLLADLTPGLFISVLDNRYSNCVVQTRINNLYPYIIAIVELRNAVYENTPPITSQTLLGPMVAIPLTTMFENDGWYLDPVPLVEEFREQLNELIKTYRNLPTSATGYTIQYRSRIGRLLQDVVVTVKGLLEYQESIH